jgi:hypothetical protein
MLTFAWGALPHDPGLSWPRVAAWARRPGRLVQEVFNRSRASGLRKLRLVAPFAVTFAAGAVARAASTYSLRVVPISYFDYDLYLKARADGGRRLVEERYIVFLDNYVPLHPDLAFSGYPRIDPARYYRSLNRFFDLLERAYGMRVAIAAHPRADYHTGTFAGRPMYRMVTAELVRDAEFVISHHSTAISYAVLNAKPLLFIHTDDIAATYAHSFMNYLRCFARCLDAPLYNIDAVGDARQIALRPVNAARYERYKYDFLTCPEAENTPTQEILWREIRAL